MSINNQASYIYFLWRLIMHMHLTKTHSKNINKKIVEKNEYFNLNCVQSRSYNKAVLYEWNGM